MVLAQAEATYYGIDVERALEIWGLSDVFRNPQVRYCSFVIENHYNGTRLEVGISNIEGTRSSSSLGLVLATIDCPRVGSGQEKPHQVLLRADFRGIVEIEYHEDGYINFKRPGRTIRIFRTGYFCT